jgi:hypothetical protein
VLGLYYIRWTGTSEEFKEYYGRAKEIADGIEGADVEGVFLPTSEWNFVALVKATSFDKIMETYTTYIKKYGPPPKIPLAKLELLLPLQELGYPT